MTSGSKHADEASSEVADSAAASGRGPAPADPRAAAALARNDRYLLEFVEALSLCPWARRCREMGRLECRVILAAGGEPETPAFEALMDDAMTAVCELAARPPGEVEIGLLLFPALVPALRAGVEGARAFEQVCNAVRAAMQQAFAQEPGGQPFYCVAFHPELGMDLADANRAVRFIRRSPDPTLQLVRVSVLQAARGSDPLRYVDASRMTREELMAVQSPETISERIARLNWETLQREGPEKLRALLEGMSAQ